MTNEINYVKLVNKLMDLHLFRDMDGRQIDRILDACSAREVEVGEVLCNPLTTDDRLIVLVKGRLSLESSAGEKLADILPLRVIGQMGVFTGQSRETRVVADEQSVVLELEPSQLQSLLEEDPEIINSMQISMIKGLYERIGSMNEDIMNLQDQTSRLRSRLQELAPGDPLLSASSP